MYHMGGLQTNYTEFIAAISGSNDTGDDDNMYTVILGKLPPKKYATFEQAWGCYYLDARRGCVCWGRGECRCERFNEIKALLAEHGAVGLHAAVIYAGDVRPAQMWHTSMRRLLPIKAEVYGDAK